MALLNLDAALAVDSKLGDAYLVRTQVYSAMGDIDNAIENLKKYIELTQDTSLYESVAQLQEARGDIAAAQEAWEKYVSNAGAEIEDAQFQNGLYKMEAGDWEGAVASFEGETDRICVLRFSDLCPIGAFRSRLFVIGGDTVFRKPFIHPSIAILIVPDLPEPPLMRGFVHDRLVLRGGG